MTDTTQAPAHWVRPEGQDDDATIDGYELFCARRALALLKGRLGREKLLELLAQDIQARADHLREQVRLSAGHELSGTTTLRGTGISAAAFGAWLAQAFARQDVLLAAHPEHYSIHHAPGHDVNIVETLGEHVCSFYMRLWDATTPAPPTPGSSADAVDATQPGDGARRSHIVLADGTVVGSVATAFQDTDDGLLARLSVTLPATCQAPVDQHLEHFAVEFRTWILQAAREHVHEGNPAR